MSEPEIPHTIAGPSAVLARRYATALFELADSSGQLETVMEDMRTLRTLLQGNDAFRHWSRHPRLTRPQLVAMAQEVSAAAKLCPLASSFLALLAQKRRLALLIDMIAVFLFDVHVKRGEKTAVVKTAHAFTDAQRKTLTANLEKIVNAKVNMVVDEDPGLMGGFIVKIGSKMIDASVKGRLARIERHLASKHSDAAA